MAQRKGYVQSDEHKQRLSAALKAAHEKRKFGFEPGNTALRMTGKTHAPETIEKMSETRKKNNPMWNEETRQKVSKTRIEKKIGTGESNPNWKGGITPVNNRLRMRREYLKWRKEVLTRDNNTCQKCGSKEKLQAHHIKQFSQYPELRYDVGNGITLCHTCHAKETAIEMKNNRMGKRVQT